MSRLSDRERKGGVMPDVTAGMASCAHRIAARLGLFREATSSCPVSHKSPRIPARKSPNFSLFNSVFTLSVSPLFHPPGYCGSSLENYPESSSEGCSVCYPVRNPRSCVVSSPACCRAGYSERRSASCSEGRGGRSPVGSSAGCAEDCPASSPESNSPSSGADNLLSNSESNKASRAVSRPGNSE